MRSPTWRERLRYRFDAFMSRGTVALIIGLFGVSVAMILAVSAVIWIIGEANGANGFVNPVTGVVEDPGFFTTVWWTLLRTLDPGTMGGDSGQPGFLLAMFLITMGGIFIVATLIGIISSGIEGRLAELRKGRSRVIEEGHTVILGWSQSIFTILAELIEANANHRKATVVVLADRDKVQMEDEIRNRLPDTRSTTIVCRSGSPIDLDEIDIASPQTSAAIILPSPAGDEPDAEVLKTLLAIIRDPNRRREPYHVVAELHDPANLRVGRMVAGPEAEFVLADDFIARITAQTCRQPGLSFVYTELLGFAGAELYLTHQPGLAGMTFGEALLAFEDSCLVGILPKGGEVLLNPSVDMRIGPDDEALTISEDDSTVRVLSANERVDPSLIRRGSPLPASPERTLVLGWNRLAATIIRELDHYLAPGSSVSVVAAGSTAGPAVERLQASDLRTQVSFRSGDTTSRELLDDLDVPSHDHVILLGYSDTLDAQKADARTLVTLLHLRDIAAGSARVFSIVSEMLDVRNRDLAEVTRADDFIVSDRLVSLYLAQVAQDKRLAGVFTDIFDAAGMEIYLKPVEDYVALGQPVSFATVVRSAAERGHVAIGYRATAAAGDDGRGYGIAINPSKRATLTYAAGDRIIVIAED